MLKQIIISALLFGVEGQYRSRQNRKVDGNPVPPIRRRLNTSNATSNATAAPTTAAPTTVAATTAAPTTVAATEAATTVAATTAAAEETTVAATTVAATEAATTVAATTVATNGTNGTTIPLAKVSTTIEMTVKLDISAMSTVAKTAVGNSFAFGIHSSACKGISKLWTTLGQCMLGQGKADGVTFSMAMNIDSKLVGTTQPGCASATDCYGASTAAPSRMLAAEDITNGGTFEVQAKGAAVIAQAQEAQTALTAAKATGTFSAASIATEVQAAMARPAMNKTLTAAGVTAAIVADVIKATKEAKVTTTVSKVQGSTPAPASTSNAYTAGVTGVLALAAGALLF